MEPFEALSLSADHCSITILDQSQLPNRMVYHTATNLEEMVEAIQTLRVRGAPAIGIYAGYCIYVLAQQLSKTCQDIDTIQQQLSYMGKMLIAARPTAVNLPWAVNRMLSKASICTSVSQLLSCLGNECVTIHREDMDMCLKISEYGLSLLKEGDGVLTHCNAGPLATSRYGTGQGPFHLAAERGFKLHVYADETRPLLQGARLTAWELERAGVDVTLICDNMASMVMREGRIQACFVGCDRVAANGDVANKIGTSGVAILAKYYGIPFYVLGPTSTIDLSCPDGEHIPIELRDPEEIRSLWYQEPMAPPSVSCLNPAFDVTDHSLITAIITEKGICRPPFTHSLAALFES